MTLADRPETLSDLHPHEMASHDAKPFLLRLPWYAYAGAALNIAAWTSSWARVGPWDSTFFPLWFGFILVLDGIAYTRTGTSLLHRSAPRFALLFLYSIPFWWAFEALNGPVQNWHYILDQPYSALEYNILASIAFSTVLPAVMEVAEILASFKPLKPRCSPAATGTRLRPAAAIALFGVGVLMVVLPVVFPRYAFGLIWLALIFLLDPINNLAGRKSAFGRLLAGDWRFIAVLALGALCCGFFWEMWNYYALPKWYYTVPFVDAFPHLFEMPLPGFLGYLPFGVELFCMYELLLLLSRRSRDLLAI